MVWTDKFQTKNVRIQERIQLIASLRCKFSKHDCPRETKCIQQVTRLADRADCLPPDLTQLM